MLTGENTALTDTPSDGQIFNWTFGGVMEVYYVVPCWDYTAGGHLTFHNNVVLDQHLNPVFNPKWSVGFNPIVTPRCYYFGGSTPRSTVLW